MLHTSMFRRCSRSLKVRRSSAGSCTHASTSTAKAIAGQLNGSLELALVDAALGNRLIDLTGQDIVSWLFAGGAKEQARLTCAVAGLNFTHGNGAFVPLIIATDNVRLTGHGSLNVGEETIDIAFDPRPLHKGLVNIVTPFGLTGPLAEPQITGVHAVDIAGRVVAETITLPLRPLDLLIRHAGADEKTRASAVACDDIAALPEP
jgi:hypothetical protein